MTIFKNKEKENINDLENIFKRILYLSQEQGNNIRSEFDIRTESQQLYEIVSKKLFDAVKIKNFTEISKILENNFLIKNKLLNENGYNIMEYSLNNNDNELFKYLYENLYNSILSYFADSSILFTIILNKKNLDLVKFFLENKDLGFYLKKENITNCLFVALQHDATDLVDLLINNYLDLLDSRNIEASMIYSISHNQTNELKLLFSYPVLISKFSNENIEKMLAFSLMNQNVKALEIMTDNKHFMNIIENSDIAIKKNILQAAYNNKNIFIMQNFLKNDKLKNIKDILKIENITNTHNT